MSHYMGKSLVVVSRTFEGDASGNYQRDTEGVALVNGSVDIAVFNNSHAGGVVGHMPGFWQNRSGLGGHLKKLEEVLEVKSRNGQSVDAQMLKSLSDRCELLVYTSPLGHRDLRAKLVETTEYAISDEERDSFAGQGSSYPPEQAYCTVVGLPVEDLLRVLERAGIELDRELGKEEVIEMYR